MRFDFDNWGGNWRYLFNIDALYEFDLVFTKNYDLPITLRFLRENQSRRFRQWLSFFFRSNVDQFRLPGDWKFKVSSMCLLSKTILNQIEIRGSLEPFGEISLHKDRKTVQALLADEIYDPKWKEIINWSGFFLNFFH